MASLAVSTQPLQREWEASHSRDGRPHFRIGRYIRLLPSFNDQPSTSPSDRHSPPPLPINSFKGGIVHQSPTSLASYRYHKAFTACHLRLRSRSNLRRVRRPRADFCAGVAQISFIDRRIGIAATAVCLNHDLASQSIGSTFSSGFLPDVLSVQTEGESFNVSQHTYLEEFDFFFSQHSEEALGIALTSTGEPSFGFDPPSSQITPVHTTVQHSSGDLSDYVVPNINLFPLSNHENQPLIGQNLHDGNGSHSAVSPLEFSVADRIRCTWPSCSKIFPSIHVYNHHFKNHSRPFQCSVCPARHATKRQRDRHVNECHSNTEGYYCSVTTCMRSMASGGKPFPRMENCKRHMMMAHKFTAEQARICDMDEETRRIRADRKRKVGKRVGA